MADAIWQTKEYRDLIQRKTLATDNYAPKVGVVTLNGNATDSNLTMQSNGATTSYRFGYNPISSFPRYKEGLSSQETGIKLTNLVSNGNFVDATGWSSAGGSGSVSNNTYSQTGNGSANYPNIIQTLPRSANHVYAVTLKCRVTNTNCLRITFSYGISGAQFVFQQEPKSNTWYQKTIVYTETHTRPSLQIVHWYADAATANEKVMEVQYVSCIDLTAEFGAGNEPTQEQFEATLATTEHSWFDGVGTFNVVTGGIQTLNCPSVAYPSTITSSLAAGTYKYVGIDGIYEFVLPAELHGIGTLLDRITFNEVSGIGSLARRCAEIASYAGESITTPYLSSTGALTTGANVVYVLPTATTNDLTFTKVSSSTATEVPFAIDWTRDVFFPTTFDVRFVTTIGGTEYTLDGSSIKQASSESSSVSGSTFSFGDFIGKTAEMTVYDIDGDYDEVSFEGASGVLSYGVKRSNGDYYWVSSGTYYVDDSKHNGAMVWLSLADAKVEFDVVHSGAIGANQTLFQLAEAACTSAGITLGTVVGDLPNGTTVVTNSDTIMTTSPLTTDVMLVKYIAQATGTFAVIGRDNKLYFRWYEEVSPKYSIERNLISIGQSVADYEITTTGVSWTTTDGITHNNGTATYQLNVTNNPFSFADYATLLTGIAANVVGVSYVPIDLKWAGDPALDVGDIIVVPDRKGNAYSVPITNIRNSNTLSQTIKSVGESHLNNASVSVTNSVTASIEDVRTIAKFGTVTADRVRTGIMESTDGKTYFDLDSDEIFMDGDANGSVKINPTVGMQMLNASNVQIGGTAIIGEALASIASMLTNDATNPAFYATIGEETIGGQVYRGIFGYLPTVSTTVPAFRITTYGGSVNITSGNFAMNAGSSSIRLKTGVSPASGILTIDTANDSIQLYLESASAQVDISANRSEMQFGNKAIGVDSTGAFKRSGQTKTYL